MPIKTRYQKLLDKIDALNADKISKKNAKLICEKLYKINKFSEYPDIIALDEKNNLLLEWFNGQERTRLYISNKGFQFLEFVNDTLTQEKRVSVKMLSVGDNLVN